MDEIDMLRKYGARTEATPPPDIDVTADVMASIRRAAHRPSAMSTRTAYAAVAASWLIAIGIGFYAQQALSDWQDPMNSFTAPFSVTLE
jgi:hypothetical protein